MIGGFTFLGYNPVDLEPLLESGGTWDPIVPKPLSGTRALSDHLERERLHLTFLSCHWAAARLLGLGRRGNLLAKRQGGSGQLERFGRGVSNTALVSASAWLLPTTSCHTGLLLDPLEPPPLWGCQPLSWSQMMLVQAWGGAARTGRAGAAVAQAGKHTRKRRASQKERSQSTATQNRQARAAALGSQFKLATLPARLLVPGHSSSVRRRGPGRQGPQKDSRPGALPPKTPQRRRCDGAVQRLRKDAPR